MKKNFLAMMIALTAGFASQPHAQVLLDDWTFDLSSVGGPTVSDIDAMGFNFTVFNAERTGGAGDVAIGDIYNVEGLGVISNFNVNGTNVTPVGINSNFEITFSFDLDVAVTDVAAGGLGFDFTHNAGTDALMIFIDDLAGGGTQANGNTGVGFMDGTKIANFEVLAGLGGSVNQAQMSLDGSDDATFVLTQNLAPGVLQDADGNDLQPGDTMALTDSNFDLDPDGNNALDTTVDAFGCEAGNQNLVFFCGQEDGSVVLQTEPGEAPEPATIALLGIGLIGFGSLRRLKTV